MSEASIDAKQIGFSLVALALGAGILFLAGLHLGQDMDLLEQVQGDAVAQAPTEPSAEAPQQKAAARSEFSFFSDLRAPDKGPRQRDMPVPEGNANIKKAAEPEVTRRALARKGVKTRTLKRGARSVTRKKPALAPPTLAGRAPKKLEDKPAAKVAAKEEKAAPQAVARRVLRRQDVQQKPTAKPAGRGFTVRAGSFSEYGDAFELVQRLRGGGHAAHVILVNNAQGRSYQVRVGRFAKREEAREAMRKVQSEGVSASILNL
jgi:cell division septation protein DedD